jgi:hypothetical protein
MVGDFLILENIFWTRDSSKLMKCGILAFSICNIIEFLSLLGDSNFYLMDTLWSFLLYYMCVINEVPNI